MHISAKLKFMGFSEKLNIADYIVTMLGKSHGFTHAYINKRN